MAFLVLSLKPAIWPNNLSAFFWASVVSISNFLFFSTSLTACWYCCNNVTAAWTSPVKVEVSIDIKVGASNDCFCSIK